MKLKEQKKFGILWLSIGAALFLAGLAWNTASAWVTCNESARNTIK